MGPYVSRHRAHAPIRVRVSGLLLALMLGAATMAGGTTAAGVGTTGTDAHPQQHRDGR